MKILNIITIFVLLLHCISGFSGSTSYFGSESSSSQSLEMEEIVQKNDDQTPTVIRPKIMYVVARFQDNEKATIDVPKEIDIPPEEKNEVV
jgi:hypothetical protein